MVFVFPIFNTMLRLYPLGIPWTLPISCRPQSPLLSWCFQDKQMAISICCPIIRWYLGDASVKSWIACYVILKVISMLSSITSFLTPLMSSPPMSTRSIWWLIKGFWSSLFQWFQFNFRLKFVVILISNSGPSLLYTSSLFPSLFISVWFNTHLDEGNQTSCSMFYDTL